MFSIMLGVACISLLLVSLVACICVYRDIYRVVNEEYLRRQEAKDKYNKDPETYSTVINENEFYYPTITYGSILWLIILFGIPVLNLVTLTILGIKWVYREGILFCKSFVFPW